MWTLLPPTCTSSSEYSNSWRQSVFSTGQCLNLAVWLSNFQRGGRQGFGHCQGNNSTVHRKCAKHNVNKSGLTSSPHFQWSSKKNKRKKMKKYLDHEVLALFKDGKYSWPPVHFTTFNIMYTLSCHLCSVMKCDIQCTEELTFQWNYYFKPNLQCSYFSWQIIQLSEKKKEKKHLLSFILMPFLNIIESS